MKGLKVLAYAKLNLVLRIVGRREDGYHLLQSLFCAVDLADEIELEPLAQGIEVVAPAELGPREENLAYRAAKLLLGKDGPGVRITLRKRIPPGTGLGGGSSNAAAVLVGLNLLYELRKTEEELKDLGAKLGADVPFFLGRSPAWGEGIGERLTSLDLPIPFVFLLVIPPYPCPTAEVYRAYDALGIPFSPVGPVPKIPPFANDLWPAAVYVRPELRALRQTLEALPSLGVGLSGSGSALFLAFSTHKEAEEAQRRLQDRVEAQLWIARPVEKGYKIVG